MGQKPKIGTKPKIATILPKISTREPKFGTRDPRFEPHVMKEHKIRAPLVQNITTMVRE